MGSYVQSIIAAKSQEWRDKHEAWKRNEKRFAGGEDVFESLRPFRWERHNAGDYQARKDRAVYPEFPAMVAEKFVGILFSQWPEGEGLSLGQLETRDSGIRADMLRENADGVGADARSLFAFWAEAMQRAVATKYRWILAEGPAVRATTLADEIDGARPYLVEYSPVQVPYAYESRGTLQAVRIELTETTPEVEAGEFKEEERTIHYLMTREGFEGWGTLEQTAAAGAPPFAAGGWWMVDDEGDVIERDGEAMQGDWTRTDGEIPMCRLYYERGRQGDSRTGITHIGRIAVAYMDLFSAQMNDAWESGSGAVFLNGVNLEQWKTVTGVDENGKRLVDGKMIPVPGVEGGGQVSIQPVAMGEGSSVLNATIERLMTLAMQLIARELVTSPDASGAARQLEFLRGNAPRLVHMAGNVEEAMGASLRYLEQRWVGGEPQARVSWSRSFDLKTIIEKLQGLFELFETVGARAPRLFADLLFDAARGEGLVSNSDEDGADAIKDEIFNSMAAGVRREQIEAQRAEEALERDRSPMADAIAERRRQLEEGAEDDQ